MWLRTKALRSMRKHFPLACFLLWKASVFCCKTMQTVQYILQKLKMSAQGFMSSYMCGKGTHFGPQKRVLEPLNGSRFPCFFGSWFRICILSRFGVSRGSDLESFWHASSGTRPRKFSFFWSQAGIKCFLAFRVSSDLILEKIFMHFWVFRVAILAFLKGPPLVSKQVV